MATQLIPNYETGKYQTDIGDAIDINKLELKVVRTGFSQRVKTSPTTAQYNPSDEEWTREFQRFSDEFAFDVKTLRAPYHRSKTGWHERALA